MKTVTPRRLRVKPKCQIMGLIKDKVIMPGIYIEGRNVAPDVFEQLLSDQFKHAVEPLPDIEPEPELAAPTDTPKESAGDTYRRKRREAEEQARSERWGGKRPLQFTVPD
jgi:hypothetical protein